LSADIVTNNPNSTPMPDRPAKGFACWCNEVVNAHIAAKIAQIAALNLTIAVRVLFALFRFADLSFAP
jgi:hypothetical protein